MGSLTMVTSAKNQQAPLSSGPCTVLEGQGGDVTVFAFSNWWVSQSVPPFLLLYRRILILYLGIRNISIPGLILESLLISCIILQTPTLCPLSQTFKAGIITVLIAPAEITTPLFHWSF